MARGTKTTQSLGAPRSLNPTLGLLICFLGKFEKLLFKIMHLETIQCNYIPFQIVIDQICSKLRTISHPLHHGYGPGQLMSL